MDIKVLPRAIILARRIWNYKNFDQLFDEAVWEAMSESQRKLEEERKRAKGKSRGVGNKRRKS